MTLRASRPNCSPPHRPVKRQGRLSPASSCLRVCRLVPLVAIAAAACGKKGPPLAPLPSLPQQVSDLTVRRLSDEVYVRFRIPTTNVTGEKPADIRSVVVYGFTGRPDSNEDIVKYGTLVAEVPVRKPPPPPPPVEEGKPPPPPLPPPTGPGLDQGAYAVVAETLSPAALVPVLTKADQEKARKAKPLTEAVVGPLVGPAIAIPVRTYLVFGVNHRGRKGAYSPRATVPLLPPPPAPAAPTVTYTATAFTVAWIRPEGVRIAAQQTASGQQSDLAGIPSVGPAPSPDEQTTPPEALATPPASEPSSTGQSPPPVALISAPTQLSPPAPPSLASSPSGSPTAAAVPTPGPSLSPPAPATPAPPARPSTMTTSGAAGQTPRAPGTPAVLTARPLFPVFPASSYNVYEINRPAPADIKPAVAQTAAVGPSGSDSTFQSPEPLTPQPISETSFVDPRLDFGAERCYAVRTLNAFGALRLESAASDVTCALPVDTFAPGVPRGLAAVGSESAIDLIWEPNAEADLGGYLVLRGEAGDETLQRLTPAPIRQTTYRDSSVRRGVRYVYAVIAVDKATPSNASAPSAHVEETAR